MKPSWKSHLSTFFMLYMYSLFPYSKSIVYLTKWFFFYISFWLSIFIKPTNRHLSTSQRADTNDLILGRKYRKILWILVPSSNILKHQILHFFSFKGTLFFSHQHSNLELPQPHSNSLPWGANIFIFTRPQRSSGFYQAETGYLCHFFWF